MVPRGAPLVLAALAAGGLLAAETGFAARAAGPARARGSVFHDRDGDGARDWHELGLRGVAVSNGRDVVTTDWRGRYELPIGDEGVVFVVKPRGFSPPLSEQGLPRFAYLHRPWGSPPGLGHRGVAPTGPLPERIDFPLHRVEEPDAFRVVVLADPQPRTPRELDFFERDVIAQLEGSDAAFGLVLGDLVGDDLALFGPLNRALGRVGIPWYPVLGNHDLNLPADGDRYSDETFERVYGPATYAFAVGPVHFVVLDDVVYAGADPQDGSPGRYAGGLSGDQLAFVRAYLATVPRERLVVVAAHIPFDSPPHEVAGRRELLEILSGRPHTLSLAGHTHFQEHRFLGPEAGFRGPDLHHQLVAATASGSWWLGERDAEGIPHATMRCGAPNGYSILELDGSRYAIRFRAARRPASHQMNVFAPEVLPADEVAGTEVLVNVFAGSERSRVELRAGGAGAWLPLRREARIDPGYAELVRRDLAREPRPEYYLPPPIPSPHLWLGELPPLPPGRHELRVRTTDMFGRTHEARRSLRVLEPSARPTRGAEPPEARGADGPGAGP